MFETTHKINTDDNNLEEIKERDIEKKSIKNIKPEVQGEEENIHKRKIKNSTTENVIKVDDSEIYTMPEKFLPSSGAKFISQGVKEKGLGKQNKNILVGIIVGIFVIGLAVLGAWFLTKSLQRQDDELVIMNTATKTENSEKQQGKKDEEQDKNKDLEYQDEENIEEDNEDVNIKECSEDNCGGCDLRECQDYQDYCIVKDLCQLSEDFDNCPQYVCTTLEEMEDENLKEEDNDSEQGEKNKEYMMAKDTDFDSLTDFEEGLWGTDPINSDTDGDGYIDGKEIKNLYNPLVFGDGTGKLVDSGLVKEYVDNDFGYSIFYPSNWTKSYLGEDHQNILFTASTSEFVQVIIQENKEYEDINDWYDDNYGSVEGTKNVILGNWAGVESQDKMKVFLMHGKYIYSLIYNNGLNNELKYQTTFEMMINSLKFFESPLD